MTTADAAEQPDSARGNLLARHPLTFYFFIAFVFSWLLLLPGVLTFYGVLGLSPQLVSMMATASLLGPVLSGFLMIALTEGGAGVGLSPVQGAPGVFDALRRAEVRAVCAALAGG